MVTAVADHASLPAADTRRWTARRKAAVVIAVRGGTLTPEEACTRWQLSREELAAWRAAFAVHGVHGLRTTRLQLYRKRRSRRRGALATLLPVFALLWPMLALADNDWAQAEIQADQLYNLTDSGGLAFFQDNAGSIPYYTLEPNYPDWSASCLGAITPVGNPPGSLSPTTITYAIQRLTSAPVAPAAILNGSQPPPTFDTLSTQDVPVAENQTAQFSFGASLTGGTPSKDHIVCRITVFPLPFAAQLNEYSHFTVTDANVTPPMSTGPTLAQKQQAHRMEIAALDAAAATTAAATAVPNAQVKYILVSLTVMLGRAAYHFHQVYVDPADADYMVEVQPPALPIPSTTNQCVTNLMQWVSNLYGLAVATSQSFDKESGAIAAGDAGWATTQTNDMQKWAGQIDNYLGNGVTNAFRGQTGCLPAVAGTKTPSDIQTLLDNLANKISSGTLPPEFVRALNTEGINDPSDIANFLSPTTNADAGQAADAFNSMWGPASGRNNSWQSFQSDLGE
jgi:hypothetical protein